jgi:hypothetical protein
MARGMLRSRKPPGSHQWVFRWRPLKQPLLPKLFGLALVGAAFVFLVTSVRIRVTALEKSTPRKASVIYLRDDAQGRALTLKAQEGGPFPSRFALSQWDGMARLEAAAIEAVRFQPPRYDPKMRDLPPDDAVEPLVLAVKGERFFPIRPSAPDQVPESGRFRLAPVLYPLSGIPGEALPVALPSFDAAVDVAMSSASWRFLIRLNSEGGVVECVSLEKGGEAGALELEKWLHRIQFKPESGRPFRWIAVGVGFTNQPVADGTDAR